MEESSALADFEYFMQLAAGTSLHDKFLKRVAAAGFGIKEGKMSDTIAEFDEHSLIYDSTRFRLFDLFHEKQHLIVYEKAIKMGIPLQKLFNSRMRKVCETDAYLAELWLCERFNFPHSFISVRKELLLGYMLSARTALRNKTKLCELSQNILGYDIQAKIEEYLQV